MIVKFNWCLASLVVSGRNYRQPWHNLILRQLGKLLGVQRRLNNNHVRLLGLNRKSDHRHKSNHRAIHHRQKKTLKPHLLQPNQSSRTSRQYVGLCDPTPSVAIPTVNKATDRRLARMLTAVDSCLTRHSANQKFMTPKKKATKTMISSIPPPVILDTYLCSVRHASHHINMMKSGFVRTSFAQLAP